ncbi:MAG: hypothetical protein ACMXYE_00210 [Candidatus Woesearchaeota archaeon]
MVYETKCVICDEAITNPVCPVCLERQITHWIGEQKPSLVPILQRIGASVMEFTHDNTNCILCESNMNVCPHCYCNEIHAWLQENEHKKIAELFAKQFNFEMNHVCSNDHIKKEDYEHIEDIKVQNKHEHERIIHIKKLMQV